ALAGEAGGEQAYEQRRQDVSEESEQTCSHSKQPRDGARRSSRLLFPPLFQQLRIDRDERRAEGALAQQVLQRVGHSERRRKDVSVEGRSEVLTEDPLPDEPGDPAQQNTAGNERRGQPPR